ncbi:MAG: hypothetical protein AAFX56_12820 [Pseudomonadota bacterium]
MNDLRSVWRRISPLQSETYDIRIIQSFYQLAAWHENDTFENLAPTLAEEREITPAFFERYDYRWIEQRSSYDFPQDVLFQHFAMKATLGLWHSARPEQQHHPAFSGVGARTLFEWGTKGGSPRAIPEIEGWRIIVVPLAWYDFSGAATNGVVASLPDGVTLEALTPNDRLVETAEVKQYWDALLIKGVIGKARCNELLKVELADKLSKHAGTKPFFEPVLEPMRPADLLQEFAQRFLTGHEVGHHVSEVFDPTQRSHPELLADRLAIEGVERSVWEIHGHAYRPLLDDAKSVPIVAGHTFYFLLGMWTVISSGVGELAGESETRRNKRWNLLQARLQTWSQYLENSRENASKANPLSGYFGVLDDHLHRFSAYAASALPSLFRTSKLLDEDIIRNNPEGATPELLNQWLEETFSDGLPSTYEEMLALLRTLDQGRNT